MSTTQEKRNSIIKDLKNLLIWISIALNIRWQVIEPRWIPSGSMLPTLQIQDKILVEKVTPKNISKSNLSKLKNKIVVFNVPEQLINAGYEADTALIKRVIGIPGDKVEVREGNLYLNDIAQICGFLIKNHKEEQYKGFRKFVLGQKFISIDHAIITLLKRNNMRRYFAIPLTKKILKILLRILPIQTTPWDSFSIKKYDFNHVPITNPETFKLKSYAMSLIDILRFSSLTDCYNN